MASAGPVQAVVQGPLPRYREEWSGCVNWPSDIAGSKRSTTDSKGMLEVRVCFTFPHGVALLLYHYYFPVLPSSILFPHIWLISNQEYWNEVLDVLMCA